ncbi:MAG TPA: TIGR03067 domain-containing protein [Candidatus Polarisedimenticolaceae bacterium]|nr:TIGR03067 domain-containing protein [Candidatus Polarisedimenticolaceae bacterium]
MKKQLPSRPDLDHLRRQAKSLLSALATGDDGAAKTLIEHLPAAKEQTIAQVGNAGYRLADAQSAVARKSGFASWPALARHVTQLRGLEGTWEFTSLEIEGTKMPRAVLASSRLIIDGDLFRTESPEAIYEGVFNIDVEADPPRIDIEFVQGPEAGNWSYGIYELGGDALTICLGLTGASRPTKFVTTPGSKHALETLTRRRAGSTTPSPVAFEPSSADDLTPMSGTWKAVSVIIDGMALPKSVLATGWREVEGNRTRVAFGGAPILDAPTRVSGSNPWEVDYLQGGRIQRALVRIVDGDLESCMAPADAPRPTRFDGAKGTGWTLSRWRK